MKGEATLRYLCTQWLIRLGLLLLQRKATLGKCKSKTNPATASVALEIEFPRTGVELPGYLKVLLRMTLDRSGEAIYPKTSAESHPRHYSGSLLEAAKLEFFLVKPPIEDRKDF